MSFIDLRSDTVTLPSPAMRDAIATAGLGDDVYGEDPSVNQLEKLAAERVGKEDALLVSSGTMGNLIALLAHCGRGQHAVLGNQSHIYRYEAGGGSTLGGIVYMPVTTFADGRLDLDEVRETLPHTTDPHRSLPGVVCIENTHNRCGGTVLPLDYLQELYSLTRQYNVPLHMDGARMFNAAVALGLDIKALTNNVDTVQFCLSKGLAAPVGSMLAGSRDFIAKARRIRKMVGGGMRQAGIIAAAGIVALNEMVERLEDDHTNARVLAEGIANLPGVKLDVSRVQTNIVIFELADNAHVPTPSAFIEAMRAEGVLVSAMGGRLVRFVTHYGIEREQIDVAIKAASKVLSS
jgi:threonine aldolase